MKAESLGGLCRIIRHLGSGIQRNGDKRRSALIELARVLVRFDHVARRIVNANHGSRCLGGTD